MNRSRMIAVACDIAHVHTVASCFRLLSALTSIIVINSPTIHEHHSAVQSVHTVVKNRYMKIDL